MPDLHSDEGVIVEHDGTEALIELPDGEYVIRLVSDLLASETVRARMPKPAATAPAELDLWHADHEVLQCAAGHAYSRPRTRGKKPKWCDEHKPLKATQVPKPERPDQVLICAKGQHEWTRKPQGGKPPRWCPEHKPQPEKPAEGRTERQRGRVEAKVSPEALAILGDATEQSLLQARDELRLKIWYVVDALRTPGRDPEDIKLSLETQKRYIQQYKRDRRSAA